MASLRNILLLATSAAAVALPSTDSTPPGKVRILQADNAKAKSDAAAAGYVCIDFTSQYDNFHYSAAPGGIWYGAGSFGTHSNLCFPINDDKGGALFIGNGPNPGPGSTKLEIKFQSNGQAYGDISIVDGYSISLKCEISSGYMGGTVSLFTKNPCPDSQGDLCINTTGGSAANAQGVAPFFQEGAEDGNNYCTWHNCGIPEFNNNGITCRLNPGGY